MCEPISREAGNDPGLRRNLHAEIEDLQGRLKALKVILEGLEQRSGRQGQPSPNINASARTILNLRQHGRAILGSNLFGEGGWDMLLKLYDAHVEGRRECVSGLCAASGVPASTALRWIDHLEREGWITCSRDKDTGACVELSKQGLKAMAKVLATLRCPDCG